MAGHTGCERRLKESACGYSLWQRADGRAAVLVILALLVHWIGINTIERYRDDLFSTCKLTWFWSSLRCWPRWPWASPPALP
jgi:hypothetical protein